MRWLIISLSYTSIRQYCETLLANSSNECRRVAAAAAAVVVVVVRRRRRRRRCRCRCRCRCRRLLSQRCCQSVAVVVAVVVHALSVFVVSVLLTMPRSPSLSK